MKVVRVKKNGQRLWRIEIKDGKFLGCKIPGVWPVRDPHLKPSESQQRYSQMCHALTRIVSGKDERGFYFLIDGHADLALRALKLCRGQKPMPGWAVYAAANGWRAPQGWSTDHSNGDTVMPTEQLREWIEQIREQGKE
jgi:hypothetical protein